MTTTYDNYAEIRSRMGLRDADVSKATGISTATLSEWKKGRYQPKLDKLEKIAKRIQNNKKFCDKDNTPAAFLMSGAINTAMYKFMVSSKNFKVSDQCISCGKCEKICPMNNIKLVKGQPVFGENCTWCFGCIARCPKKAIDIKGKTEGKRRNVCPDYKAWMIKRNM